MYPHKCIKDYHWVHVNADEVVEADLTYQAPSYYDIFLQLVQKDVQLNHLGVAMDWNLMACTLL